MVQGKPRKSAEMNKYSTEARFTFVHERPTSNHTAHMDKEKKRGGRERDRMSQEISSKLKTFRRLESHFWGLCSHCKISNEATQNQQNHRSLVVLPRLAIYQQ